MSVLDFVGVRSTRDAAATRIGELNARADQLRLQLNGINTALACKAEIKAALERWVDATAVGFAPNLSQLRTSAADVAKGGSWFEGRLVEAFNDSAMAAPSLREPHVAMLKMMCVFMPQQVKKFLTDAVDAGGDWPQGLPYAERAAEYRRVSDMLTKVNDEIHEIRSQAKEAGISL